eukprot:TRINITY_DN5319_c0_g1_i3.p1 TRINITY_DN5319_c0_g1~~TRINITY_DN5319_c0_g1_i3.p1  ORF type:complete len:261 (-),score=52.36 TRINITY_DN5319_c0_g1_i3:266-1048(-)
MGAFTYSASALSLLALWTAAFASDLGAFEEKLPKIQNAGDWYKSSERYVRVLIEKGGSSKWPPCKGSHVRLAVSLDRNSYSGTDGNSSGSSVSVDYRKDLFRDCAEGETSATSYASSYYAPDCCKDSTSLSGGSGIGKVGSFKALVGSGDQIHAEVSFKLPLYDDGENAKATAVVSFTLDCVKSYVTRDTLTSESCYGGDCISSQGKGANYSCSTRGGDATLAGTIDLQDINVKFDLANLPVGYFRSAVAKLSDASSAAA